MLKVMEYRRKIKELKEEGNALFLKAEEEKRSLSAEEMAKLDGINATIDAVEGRMDSYIRLNRIPEEELRIFEPQKPEANQNERAEFPKPFRSIGEQFQSIYRYFTGRGEDPRLHEVRSILGASESIPSDGGFLVQQDLAAELLKPMWETNEIPNRCRRIPVSGPSNSFAMVTVDESSRETGSRWGGVRVYRAAEGDSVTATKPKFGRIEIKLEKLMGTCYATDENLEDAAQLSAVIQQGFTEEMGFKLSDEIIRGTGAGQCLGILESGALVTIAKETGQAADTILTENILKMWKCRRGRELVWLYNQELEDQLELMVVPIGMAGEMSRLFRPPEGNNPYGTIKGRSAIPVEVASGAGDVGDIILADLSQYLLCEKGGVRMAESIHVQFLTDQSVFRFTYRVNGQPMLKSKITPYKRTDTNFYMSPFVTLAAR